MSTWDKAISDETKNYFTSKKWAGPILVPYLVPYLVTYYSKILSNIFAVVDQLKP